MNGHRIYIQPQADPPVLEGWAWCSAQRTDRNVCPISRIVLNPHNRFARRWADAIWLRQAGQSHQGEVQPTLDAEATEQRTDQKRTSRNRCHAGIQPCRGHPDAAIGTSPIPIQLRDCRSAHQWPVSLLTAATSSSMARVRAHAGRACEHPAPTAANAGLAGFTPAGGAPG